MKYLAHIWFLAVWVNLLPGIGIAQSRLWEVPANSTANRLVLTVENSGDQQTETMKLALEDLPPYIRFQPTELILEPLAANESQEALLQFSIDRSTPIGTVDKIVIVLSSSSSSWQKELSFTYLQPTSYKLEQNFPNPFNPSTTIRYQLPTAGRVTLKLYDVLGREVATLVDEEQEPGYYDAVWDAQRAASGVYVYRLQTAAFAETKKLLLLR